VKWRSLLCTVLPPSCPVLPLAQSSKAQCFGLKPWAKINLSYFFSWFRQAPEYWLTQYPRQLRI
jgi:hypothetical protein